MTLTETDREFIEETLRGVQSELEALVHDKEWFVSDVLDQVKTSIQILQEEEV